MNPEMTLHEISLRPFPLLIGLLCLILLQPETNSSIAQTSNLLQASFFPSDIQAVLDSSNLQIEELILQPPQTVVLTGFYVDETLAVTADFVIQEGSLMLDISLLVLSGVDRTLTSTRLDLEETFASGLVSLIQGRIESFEIEGNALYVAYTALGPTPSQALPTVVSSLSPENAALLERSVNNTTNANSLAFNVDSEIVFEQTDGKIIFMIQGEGNVSKFSDPQAVQLDLTFEVTAQQGDESLTMIIEQRFVDGMLYGRGVVPTQGTCTRWITTPLNTVFLTIVGLLSEPDSATGFLSGLLIPVDAEGNASDLEPLRALFDLLDFGQFATTSRIDVGGSSARFRTEINVLGFLDSPELISLITLLVRLGGIDLEYDQAEVAARTFQLLRSEIIPELDLTIDRVIDPERHLLDQVHIDGEVIINVPSLENRVFVQQTSIEVTINMQLSQIGETFTVEVPEDPVYVSNLDELQTLPEEDLITQECDL